VHNNKDITKIEKSINQQGGDLSFWYMRQAGRHLPEYMVLRDNEPDFVKFCLNEELATKATLQPVDRYDTSAAILFSDILMIPMALGQKLSFVEKKGPILGELSIDKLSFDINKLDHVFNIVTKTRTLLPKDKTLIGFAGAPWTVIAYMIEGHSSKDYHKAKSYLLENKTNALKLFDLVIDSTVEYLLAQITAGANVVQLFDSWAGMLNDADYDKYVIEPTAKIVNKLKSLHSNIKVIGFPKSSGNKYLKYIKETKVDAVSIDYDVNLEWARDELQPYVCVQGNLHPELLKTGGRLMLNQAENIINILGQGRFIFNLGHGIDKDTPYKHVEELSNFLSGVSL